MEYAQQIDVEFARMCDAQPISKGTIAVYAPIIYGCLYSRARLFFSDQNIKKRRYSTVVRCYLYIFTRKRRCSLISFFPVQTARVVVKCLRNIMYLRNGGHFLIVSHVPELELPGGQVSVQQDGRDFNAPFREYDVRAVLVAQAGRPVGRLPGRHDVHR